ncbi:MAG TPA: phosphoribosylaminoimidazolesuccinocarboxamide synthase, partial [Pyrinomonadaceae bacterium]
MPVSSTIASTTLPGLPLFHRGKVRDVYEVSDAQLLLVATDRLSAFDCILPTPIERKGQVLTAISAFWFGKLHEITPNHLITASVDEMPEPLRSIPELRGRSTLVKRTKVFPVE